MLSKAAICQKINGREEEDGKEVNMDVNNAGFNILLKNIHFANVL